MYTAPATSARSQKPRTQTGPKPRTPLRERTQSQTNEDSTRLRRDAQHGPPESYMFSTTPFPTKPQHVLLPSTIRKQKSFRNIENELPSLLAINQQAGASRPSTAGQSESTTDERGRRAPVLQLKRSVTTLRDMYEAQVERSRPSTAASFAQRPGTANSRLRSASSSEGIAGRNAWEQLHKISADDMALLPSLSRATIEKMASESSFASRIDRTNFLTSSPNYKVYDSSSPRMAVFRDDPTSMSDGFQQSSSSGMAQTSSSSPNFVRLGRSSSINETLCTEQSSSSPNFVRLGRSSSINETLYTEQSSSSPNFVKLGTSSPGFRTSSSPTPSTASTDSRKRKHDEIEHRSSYLVRHRPFASSPPFVTVAASSSAPSLTSPDNILPSSPPRPETAQTQSVGSSSPIYRVLGRPRDPSDSSSDSSAHANLQAALSSSPMPPIQYPVIRAPEATAYSINVHKRFIRHNSTENWTSRLSPVPSEWDEGPSRSASKRSRQVHELEDDFARSDSIASEPIGNGSQVRIIPVSEEDHQHEAADELRALPRKGLAYKSPPLVPMRTNSLFGTTSSSSNGQSQSRLNSLRISIDTRRNSMRSYAHSRQNSFMSGSARPSSSASQSTTVVVPTWARRYYSGVYRDSFQFLYPSQSNSAAQLSIPMNGNSDRPYATTAGPNPNRASMAPSHNSRRSWNSIRNSLRSSMLQFVPSVLLPRNGERLEAIKSHLIVGVGPLVSNPVGPVPAPVRYRQYGQDDTIRQISEELPASDPRAHWAGITDEQRRMMEAANSTPQHVLNRAGRQSADSESIYYDALSGQMMPRSRFTDDPRLHHDRRLNTGSSVSRGFGFPFNQKGRYNALSVYGASGHPSWYRADLRDAQVICFISGFLLPFTWFIGAALPLPSRPDSFEDIEKAMYEQHPDQAGEWQDLDVVARLRLERHIKGIEELKWQNARWWKRMNRSMCIVGLVVFILVIILAVVGTKNHW